MPVVDPAGIAQVNAQVAHIGAGDQPMIRMTVMQPVRGRPAEIVRCVRTGRHQSISRPFKNPLENIAQAVSANSGASKGVAGGQANGSLGRARASE